MTERQFWQDAAALKKDGRDKNNVFDGLMVCHFIKTQEAGSLDKICQIIRSNARELQLKCVFRGCSCEGMRKEKRGEEFRCKTQR